MHSAKAQLIATQPNNEKSIADFIIDGSITIDSIEAYGRILKQFPDNPALLRNYSDLLSKQNLRDAAAKSYGKAADLYIASGQMLPAVVSKLLEWRIKSPSSQEIRRFLSTLRKGSFSEKPLKTFLDRLSYEEMITVFSCFARIRLPANQIVRKVGDPEENLYLIVSGTLKDSMYQSMEERQRANWNSTVYLAANDFFGNIYPFEQDKLSQSFTETLTQTELVKIPKARLMQICENFPDVELAMIDLYKLRSEKDEEGFSRMLRKAERHDLPINMTLEIYPDASSHHPLLVEGYSRDISIGGACVVLDAENAYLTSSISSFHQTLKNAKIQVSFPVEALALKVAGTIAWTREVLFDGKKTLALGIQFENMSPKLSGLLFLFADSLGNMK
ncbi:MAG: cyclic nucleotide-binding domain-containing protein [Desulfobacterales bacterium]|nr:MAG: cyclic nucleotide-binding domain-containing protein [Desulfobacterales bacterium]